MYWTEFISSSRVFSLLIICLLFSTCVADRKVLERYERQLNNLARKMNDGKPFIVNGKMKRSVYDHMRST